MKLSDFNKCYQELNQRVEKMLLTKREEYASGEDRLANFKHPTSLLETNPAMVCMYYQTKHFDSLIDICKKIDQGVYPSKELIVEKAGDLAAYTYLLYACLMELQPPVQKCSNCPLKRSISDDKPKDDSHTVSVHFGQGN